MPPMDQEAPWRHSLKVPQDTVMDIMEVRQAVCRGSQLVLLDMVQGVSTWCRCVMRDELDPEWRAMEYNGNRFHAASMRSLRYQDDTNLINE
jgi:hypothetical protein